MFDVSWGKQVVQNFAWHRLLPLDADSDGRYYDVYMVWHKCSLRTTGQDRVHPEIYGEGCATIKVVAAMIEEATLAGSSSKRLHCFGILTLTLFVMRNVENTEQECMSCKIKGGFSRLIEFKCSSEDVVCV